MALTFLVTGGRGYIGSHMCKYLKTLGHEVVSIDNYVTSPGPSSEEAQKQAALLGKNLAIDMGDFEKLKKELVALGPIAGAFHFAARALVGESEQNPWLYFEENVSKSVALFKLLHELKIKKVIFSSTCATYGVPQVDFINETTIQNPVNSYGRSKLILEEIVQDLVRHHYFHVYALRYFNVAGCAPDGSLGEHHEPETHVIPNLVKSLLVDKASFSINGDQYPTPDGTCIRDYVHVEDLVRGHWMAMEKLLGMTKEKSSQGFWDAINLGTGDGKSVKELLALTESVTGKIINKQLCPPRPGDPPRLVADASKAKRVLNFETQYSVRDSIEHTWNYWKNYANRK
jgi:UDP-glucose 4-epimerase